MSRHALPPRHPRLVHDQGWWRANRWWLPVVPLAFALMVAASSYNVRTWWYDSGLHHEVARAGAGAFTDPVTVDYDDAQGRDTRTFRVRLSGLGQADTFAADSFSDPEPPPDGLDAVTVQLDWQAEPDQVLIGCTVTLVDDQGRRYEDVERPVYQCVPADTPGPSLSYAAGVPRGQVDPGAERPAEWSTAPVVLVPEGRRITRVLVSWTFPDYVALPVP